MAVIPLSELNQTITIMSPQSLFFGLFFGLGGGILLFIVLSAILYWRYGIQEEYDSVQEDQETLMMSKDY